MAQLLEAQRKMRSDVQMDILHEKKNSPKIKTKATKQKKEPKKEAEHMGRLC